MVAEIGSAFSIKNIAELEENRRECKVKTGFSTKKCIAEVAENRNGR
jgi:hypothetical protein